MKTAYEYPPLPDRLVSEIKLLSDIAKANGSIISLREIAALTHSSLSEEELRTRWNTVPDLARSYELKNGFVLEKGFGDQDSRLKVLERESEKRARAERNARLAREFVAFCREKETRLIAISGSTSYQTVSEDDDLDFFCITRPKSLWVFLTKSMLQSRIFRFSRREAPRICFSYAMDQEFAERAFATSNDPLFARDALTTIVIQGAESYEKLLKRSPWISDYFPRLYLERTDTANLKETTEEPTPYSAWRKFLNHLLWITVGNYIAAKSALLNRRFRKQRRSSALFTVSIGPDHCIFESTRYSRLRAIYSQFRSAELSPPIQPVSQTR